MLALALLLLPAALTAAPPARHAADFLLPGYGSFVTGHPVSGSLLASGRIATAYLAYYFREREIEYRSAENAARIAEWVYGPGYRFRNPYGSGYYSAAEYRRLAGRREFYWHVSLVVHVGLLITGQILTDQYYQEQVLEQAPVFKEARADAVLFQIRF